VATANLGAATVYVEDIQLPCGVFWWYIHTGGESGYVDIDNHNPGLDGQLRTFGSAPGVYDYRIEDFFVSVTNANLFEDYSSGNVARGRFTGGGQIILSGTVVSKADTNDTYSGTILVADMVITDAETWNIIDDGYDNFSGTIEELNPTDGGLNSGINVGDVNLKMGSFQANFAFNGGEIGEIMDFSTQNILSMLGTQIEITAIPEPASVLIFTFGTGILVVKRKKK
jgi:hypothetical protein